MSYCVCIIQHKSSKLINPLYKLMQMHVILLYKLLTSYKCLYLHTIDLYDPGVYTLLIHELMTPSLTQAKTTVVVAEKAGDAGNKIVILGYDVSVSVTHHYHPHTHPPHYHPTTTRSLLSLCYICHPG